MLRDKKTKNYPEGDFKMNNSLDYADMFRSYNKNAMWQMLSARENNTQNSNCINNNYCALEPRENTDGVLTMAFVNMQPLDSVYTPAEALCKGTLFPNIDKPFMGGMRR